MEIPHMVRTMSHAECVLYTDHVKWVEGAVLAESIRLGGIAKRLHEIVSGLKSPKTWGGGGNNPGISGGSGTIEANVTKGYLLDGTEISVENLGAEGGVTIRPQPKFKVGDVVVDLLLGLLPPITKVEYREGADQWYYSNGKWTIREGDLTLYAPPATTCGCPGGYVKEATAPEPKFKVRDRVVYFGYIGTVDTVTIYDAVAFGSPLVNYLIELDGGSLRLVVEWELTLYVPPTPAELIPTLKEHEWVRGTYKTGIAFGPCSVYYNEIGAMFAGDNHLIHWDTGKISDELATLERCEAPEVK